MATKKHTKNTANKAKHSKLMKQKKNRLQKEKDLRTQRLKAIIKGMNEKNDKA